MLTKVDAAADVYKGDVDPNAWVVTALDPTGDSGIFKASFSGPDAQQRALEYAAAKFRGFQLYEPGQQPYQSYRSGAASGAQSPSRGATLRLAK